MSIYEKYFGGMLKKSMGTSHLFQPLSAPGTGILIMGGKAINSKRDTA
jgi:hypothetical protein